MPEWVQGLLAGSPPSPALTALRTPRGPPRPPGSPSWCSRHCWGLAGCWAGKVAQHFLFSESAPLTDQTGHQRCLSLGLERA